MHHVIVYLPVMSAEPTTTDLSDTASMRMHYNIIDIRFILILFDLI